MMNCMYVLFLDFIKKKSMHVSSMLYNFHIYMKTKDHKRQEITTDVSSYKL